MTTKFFKGPTPKDITQEREAHQAKEADSDLNQPFGLQYLEKMESQPRQCLTVTPGFQTFTPRNDGDWGPADGDF